MRTSARTADFADVRAANLGVVLRHLRGNAPCSRADIAAATGLNKATVSSLIAHLIDRRLVREDGPGGQRVGRPATMLVLDGRPYATIGVEVGSDHLTVLAVDLVGTLLLSWQRSLAEHLASPGQTVATIAALARRAAARATLQGRRVLGLTVAVAGLVDLDGVVRGSPHLGWSDVDLRGERRGCLEALAGVPALIRRALPDAEAGLARADLAPDVDDVARRAHAKDPAALDALAETGRWLGRGAALANVFNPEVVILGGYFARLAPWLSPAAEAELAVRAVAPHAGGSRIVPATLGAESAVLGAAARILDDIDDGQLPDHPFEGRG